MSVYIKYSILHSNNYFAELLLLDMLSKQQFTLSE